MGDIKRKRKSYIRPRNIYDRKRIDDENVLVRNYGLKNKKEVWKAKSAISKFRRRAKDLIGEDMEKQMKFFDKLKSLGIRSDSTSDVLALTEKDLLDRRLQTFVYKKEFASSPKQARQLIVHKHITVDGKTVNVPSFWVTLDLENKIEVKPFKPKEQVILEEDSKSKENTQGGEE